MGFHRAKVLCKCRGIRIENDVKQKISEASQFRGNAKSQAAVRCHDGTAHSKPDLDKHPPIWMKFAIDTELARKYLEFVSLEHSSNCRSITFSKASAHVLRMMIGECEEFIPNCPHSYSVRLCRTSSLTTSFNSRRLILNASLDTTRTLSKRHRLPILLQMSITRRHFNGP